MLQVCVRQEQEVLCNELQLASRSQLETCAETLRNK
jgi:hypothetical protein